MSKTFLTITLLLTISSLSSSQKFCDIERENRLIEYVFSYNDILYAYRKPDFWLLSHRTGRWAPITNTTYKFSELFQGYDNLEDFDSGFVISHYNTCDTSAKKCINYDQYFDPTNVAFLFRGENYYVYRRKADNLFTKVESNEMWIPWEANKAKDNLITNLFIGLNFSEKVQTSVFSPMEDIVVVIANRLVTEYGVYDKPKAHVFRNSRPQLRHYYNGGFLFDGKIYILADNVVHTYSEGRLIEKKQTVWPFFCDLKANLFEVMTPIPMDSTSIDESEPGNTSETNDLNATELATDFTDIPEEPITELSKEPMTESSEEPMTELSEEPMTELSEEPMTELSEEPMTELPYETTHGEVIEIETTVLDKTPETVVNRDEDFRSLIRVLSILTLTLTLITAFIITTCAIFGFNTLSKDLTQK